MTNPCPTCLCPMPCFNGSCAHPFAASVGVDSGERYTMNAEGRLEPVTAEPREWKLSETGCGDPVWVEGHEILKGENVHVIEKSAYDALAAENAKYIARNEELRATQFSAISDQAREIEKLKAKLSGWKSEREDYRAEVASLNRRIIRLEEERDQARGFSADHVRELEKTQLKLYETQAELRDAERSWRKDAGLAEKWRKELSDARAEIARLSGELKEYKLWEKSVPDYLAQEVRLKNERDAARSALDYERDAKEAFKAMMEHYRAALEQIANTNCEVRSIAREALEEK